MNRSGLFLRVFRRAHKRLGASPRAMLALAASLALLVVCPLLYAELSVSDVMRVEEDWEVVLNEPDTNMNAPQFHTVISPFSELDCFYTQICWNYRQESEFAPGGMQLICWLGDWCVGRKNCREDLLSTAAETITWTQAMRSANGVLNFEILNGSSQTWGEFGGTDMTLAGQVGVSNLNGYSTDFSARHSWISYGSNRVNLLRIKEVRKYDANGVLLSRDQAPRVVYQLQ